MLGQGRFWFIDQFWVETNKWLTLNFGQLIFEMILYLWSINFWSIEIRSIDPDPNVKTQNWNFNSNLTSRNQSLNNFIFKLNDAWLNKPINFTFCKRLNISVFYLNDAIMSVFWGGFQMTKILTPKIKGEQCQKRPQGVPQGYGMVRQPQRVLG